MTSVRKSGSSNVVLTTLKRRSGATWVAIQNGYRRSGTTWVKIYSAYKAISITANNVSGTIPASKGTYTIGTSTVTVTGGNGTFTYTCARIAGDTFAAVSGTGASRIFKYTNVVGDPIEPGSETWRWTVSDGVSSDTQDFTVSYS